MRLAILAAGKTAGAIFDAVAGGIAEVIVTSVALRDLVRRPAALVRGPKLLWAPLLFVQPVGSPLYLIAGRRAAAA